VVPRTEARIFTSIWKDPHFLTLDPGSQRLYFFLLSQDDLAYSGLMPLRVPRWARKAAGCTTADIEASLKVLEASPRCFIVTDEDTGELLVRSLLRVDGIWKQPNLLKLARESAEQLESPRLRAALLAELRRLPLEQTGSDQVKTLVADFIQDLEQGTPYPTPYPPENPDPYPADDPPDDPTAKDYARAQGYGVGNGSSGEVPRTPEPLSPKTSTALDRKRGTRLPDNFAVTAEMVAWFRENCPNVDGKTETDAFIDYWHSKPGREGCKLDWVATWRNWMRNQEKRAGPRVRTGRPSVPESTTDQRVAQAQALKDRFREREQGPAQPELPPNTITGEIVT
jgi:hypothetical protein